MTPRLSDILKQQLARLPEPQQKSVLVAVSGGIDSVVLLHLLKELVQPAGGLTLEVAHFDHQMRPESEDDAGFVRDLCSRWELPCHLGSADVPQFAVEHRQSLETAARNLRREFLQRTAEQLRAELIALGHHRDDQAETFMQRLLRGSGAAGLVGMRHLQEPWWRPLLEVGREQIHAYAGENRLTWIEDSSNQDPSFQRNRVRHQLLPELRRYNPAVTRRLVELSRQFQVDEDFWQEQLTRRFPEILVSCRDGLRLSRPGLLSFHSALRLRLLRQALRQLRGDLQRIESDHLLAIEFLLASGRSQGQLDLPGCWAGRRYQELWLRLEAPQPLEDYQLDISAPGELLLPCGRTLLTHLIEEQGEESPNVAHFPASLLKARLRVRNWRPGDRFAPQGMVGHKSLKAYFSDEKVELEERHRLPLLVNQEEILWLIGRRRSRMVAADFRTGPMLRFELI